MPSLRPRRWRSKTGAPAYAIGLVVAGAGLLSADLRPASIIGTLLLAVAVGAVARSGGVPLGFVLLRMAVGLGPAVLFVAAVQDLAAIAVPRVVTGLALAAAWTLTTRVLGGAATRGLTDSTVVRDALSRMLAVGSVTAFVAAAMGRLLRPDVPITRRLSWILGEEDNAHVVGVAREVLTFGPRGDDLADQYGTAFMNLPILLADLFGGLPVGDQDPRLRAISAFTASTLVVTILAGLAMAVLAALLPHVRGTVTPSSIPPRVTVVASLSSAAVAAIGMSLLVVLPMRSGFLTFVWGLTFVLLGAASTAALPDDAAPRERVALLAVLLSLGVLLLRSWPFILPALAGLLLLPLMWVPWGRALRSARRHPVRVAVGLLGSLAFTALITVLFSRWGPAAEVLSYGTNILTFSGSGISADDLLTRAGVLSATAATALLIAGRGRIASTGATVAIVGPILGAFAFYGALRVAAALLTGGVLNYSGVKLFYGAVVLATILGLLTVVAQASRRRLVLTIAGAAIPVLLLVSSPTASLITDWWSRTDLGEPPHAVAAVRMIEQTTPDTPIRCLPAPGTVVSGASRWAAYWCARWMEDAFNDGRFQGYRDELLNAETETFGPVIEEILADAPSEYLFSARMTMGPGWFGWDGR